MNAVAIPQAAAPFAGGFYGGRILISGVAYALIVAPKAEGHRVDVKWNGSYKMVEGSTSFNDGLANTIAMADAGSELAQWALGLRIGGLTDWYIGSQDEMEIVYRTVKPGTAKNSLWGRSGINVSAIPPTYPYTLDFPAQTQDKLVRTGGAEAFDEVAYWTSTQHAADGDYAYCQDFVNGFQFSWSKDDKLRARAVRRLPVSV